MDCIIHGVVKSPTCVSNFHLLTRPLYLSPETLYEGQEATVRTRHQTDWFQIEKIVHQGCVLPAYLTYTQSTQNEMLSWLIHKLDSRLPGEISTTLGVQMIPL